MPQQCGKDSMIIWGDRDARRDGLRGARMFQRYQKDLIAIPLLTALYFCAGKLGLSLALVHVSASAIWPPTGW